MGMGFYISSDGSTVTSRWRWMLYGSVVVLVLALNVGAENM